MKFDWLHCSYLEAAGERLRPGPLQDSTRPLMPSVPFCTVCEAATAKTIGISLEQPGTVPRAFGWQCRALTLTKGGEMSWVQSRKQLQLVLFTYDASREIT